MDKRYQVFISSTFKDLHHERQAVLKAIMQLDHIPAGMEMFAAGDDDAWALIQSVIDLSDYYVLIIAGRYGSTDEDGISYTEKEYDYAVSLGIPVIPLLHENPDGIPRGDTETEDAAWEALNTFRTKVEDSHTCSYWTDAKDLQLGILSGLSSEIKRHPKVGWVRSDTVVSGDAATEILRLRKELDGVRAAVDAERSRPPSGAEGLCQGDDLFEFEFSYVVRSSRDWKDSTRSLVATTAWDAIFRSLSTYLINESLEDTVRAQIRSTLAQCATRKVEATVRFQEEEEELRRVVIPNLPIGECLVQLGALGLIRETTANKKRGVNDKSTYWALTDWGKTRMTQLLAKHKRSPSDPGAEYLFEPPHVPEEPDVDGDEN